MVAASGGYDLPAFEKLTTLKTWAEEGPPKGTLYHYPNPHNHQTLSIAAAPAPPAIAFQIYTQAVQTKMVARHLQGESARADARLGRERSRRLHAGLMAAAVASPSAALRTLDGARAEPMTARGRDLSVESSRWPISPFETVPPSATRAGRRASAREFFRAEVDRRVPLHAAADPADRDPRDLPGLLLRLSRHAEQAHGPVRRAVELHLPVHPRNLLDGGEAVLHLRDHRRHLQGPHRLHRRPSRPRDPEQGPAQVARHAARPMGDPAGPVDARLAVAVRPVLLGLQLCHRGARRRPYPVDRRRALGALLGDPRQHLDRRALLHDHVSRGAQIGAGRALRGRGDRRRDAGSRSCGTSPFR